MIVVDRKRLKAEWRNLEYEDKLEELLEKTAMLKPLATFEVSDKDVITRRYRDDPSNANEQFKTKYTLKRIRVYENGERIGSIGVSTRWRHRQEEFTYEVEGFRIAKARGSRNVTQTANLKTAISTIKKVFVPREDVELKQLISNNVTQALNQLHGTLINMIRWDFNVESELTMYAMEAYKARRRGDSGCSMPARPISVGDIKTHDKKCDEFDAVHGLYEMVQAKKGLGIKTNHDKSIAVYSFETDSITKFNSYDDLPEAIASKYAVFHVLNINEAQPSIGVKFQEGYAFIAN